MCICSCIYQMYSYSCVFQMHRYSCIHHLCVYSRIYQIYIYIYICIYISYVCGEEVSQTTCAFVKTAECVEGLAILPSPTLRP